MVLRAEARKERRGATHVPARSGFPEPAIGLLVGAFADSDGESPRPRHLVPASFCNARLGYAPGYFLKTPATPVTGWFDRAATADASAIDPSVQRSGHGAQVAMTGVIENDRRQARRWFVLRRSLSPWCIDRSNDEYDSRPASRDESVFEREPEHEWAVFEVL
jgi:hypothetical protein